MHVYISIVFVFCIYTVPLHKASTVDTVAEKKGEIVSFEPGCIRHHAFLNPLIVIVDDCEY